MNDECPRACPERSRRARVRPWDANLGHIRNERIAPTESGTTHTATTPVEAWRFSATIKPAKSPGFSRHGAMCVNRRNELRVQPQERQVIPKGGVLSNRLRDLACITITAGVPHFSRPVREVGRFASTLPILNRTTHPGPKLKSVSQHQHPRGSVALQRHDKTREKPRLQPP